MYERGENREQRCFMSRLHMYDICRFNNQVPNEKLL